jgi:hypothetical protein
MALDGQTKCDPNAVKVDLEVALVSSIFSTKRIDELKQQVRYEKELGYKPKESCKQPKLNVFFVMLKLLSVMDCMPIL